MIALILGALLGPLAFAAQSMPTPSQGDASGQGALGADIGKLTSIASQMSRSLGGLPNDVQRIAPFPLKADSRDFSPGMLRQIQGRLETVLQECGRTVVASPELKTVRIVSTDSSFHVSNTAPDLEELAKLADRLRVDGYMEGSCARTSEGDVLVSLRIFRARGGDVAWSGNFVAGPNRGDQVAMDLDFSISIPIRIFPASSVVSSTGSYGNANFISNVAGEVAATENITQDKKFQVTVSAGYAHFTTYSLPNGAEHPDFHMAYAGLEVLGVFFRKSNPDMGYWLGAYAGYEQFVPFLYRETVGAFRLGYRSKLSRHFSASAGVMVIPFQNTMTGIVSNDGQKITFEKIGYEVTFLHYTF